MFYKIILVCLLVQHTHLHDNYSVIFLLCKAFVRHCSVYGVFEKHVITITPLNLLRE